MGTNLASRLGDRSENLEFTFDQANFPMKGLPAPEIPRALRVMPFKDSRKRAFDAFDDAGIDGLSTSNSAAAVSGHDEAVLPLDKRPINAPDQPGPASYLTALA